MSTARSYVLLAALVLMALATGPGVLVPGALFAGPMALFGALLFL